MIIQKRAIYTGDMCYETLRPFIYIPEHDWWEMLDAEGQTIRYGNELKKMPTL